MDWVIPGVLGMNLMFSALFGVGFVIVRYRKNGVLKRLRATPLTAFEFLSAQIASRLLMLLSVTTLVFIGTNLLVHFQMFGSYWLLLSDPAPGLTQPDQHRPADCRAHAQRRGGQRGART